MTEICHILSYLLEKEERKKTAIVEFRISATIYLRHKLIACFFRAVDIAYPCSFLFCIKWGFSHDSTKSIGQPLSVTSKRDD